MTKRLILYPSFLILFSILLTSCSRYSYSSELGYYHRVKKDKCKDVVAGQTKITRETEQISSLPQKNIALVTSLNPESQMALPINENYIASSVSKKQKAVKNISAMLNGLLAGNNDSETSMDIFVNKKVNSITSAHDDGSAHLAVKGLIFLLIGILLVNGLWLTGVLGFVLAVIGVIFIIYGIILLLESL